ncbi:hypothetical protein SprV_0401529500 [Sparganum proliferum]
MRIHESGIDPSHDTSSVSFTSSMPSTTNIPSPSTPNTISSTTLSTFCTPTMSNPTHTPSPSVSTIICSTTATISGTNTDTADFSCPHCSRTFAPHIDLLIHRTATDEPVSGAPAYTRRIRHNCPHCTRTFMHRMGLLGYMRIHENL